MKFIKKLQKLPTNQKTIILWSVVIVFSIIFSVWRISIFVTKMETFKEVDFYEKTGIIPQKETVSEIRKGLDLMRESTEALKGGFNAIKELAEEVKISEEISEDLPDSLINNKF